MTRKKAAPGQASANDDQDHPLEIGSFDLVDRYDGEKYFYE